ncbi:MAG: hypothetical protein LBB91_02335, partial [Clostridiales bacterium]|nr:hypothetical protein [Clostridiales bacterium]
DYIERMGTGINRMIDAMLAAGLKKPIFQTEGYFFKVVFERPNPNADAGTAIGSDRTAIEPSDRESAVLDYLKLHGKGKSADFTKLLGLSAQRVREILQEMAGSGLIGKHGDKRHTYYTAKVSNIDLL